MSLSMYLSFFILVVTMVYSPGPMTMFMMVNGMKLEYKKIWPILIGANNAYLLSILLFSVGLTQALQQHVFIFKALQCIGIAYLFYLAVLQWNKKSFAPIAIDSFANSKNASSLYMKGALVAFSNPKTIVLFSIIFPQFVIDDESRLSYIAILGITFLLLQFSSGCFYAYFGRWMKDKVTDSFYQMAGFINRKKINKSLSYIFSSF